MKAVAFVSRSIFGFCTRWWFCIDLFHSPSYSWHKLPFFCGRLRLRPHYAVGILKKAEVLLSKRIKYFSSTPRRRNLKPQQLPVILDLCLRKTWSGKTHDSCEVVVFEKLRFRDSLVWTVGLTAERKLRFQIPPAECGCCSSVNQCKFLGNINMFNFLSVMTHH